MKLHELFIDEGIHDQDIFKFVFVLGSPASGKSHYSRKIARSTGLRIVDPDMFFELIYKKNVNSDLKTMSQNRDSTENIRNNIVDLNKNRLSLFKSNRLGFIFDGTGGNFSVFKDIYDKATSLGYEGMALFVTCELEETLRRNNERSRTEDEDFIIQAYENFHKNIPRYENLFGTENTFFLDNTNMAEGNRQYDVFFKKLRKFLNKKINNKVAIDWINSFDKQRTA